MTYTATIVAVVIREPHGMDALIVKNKIPDDVLDGDMWWSEIGKRGELPDAEGLYSFDVSIREDPDYETGWTGHDFILVKSTKLMDLIGEVKFEICQEEEEDHDNEAVQAPEG